MSVRAQISIAALSAVAAVFFLAPAASAQDEGGDDAAAAQEAPFIEYNDPRRKLSIQLPGDWRAEKGSVSAPRVAAWELPSADGEGAQAKVYVTELRSHMRPELARQMQQRGRGIQVEGTRRYGKGFSESCRIDSKMPLALFERFVESNGMVYLVQFVCHKSARVQRTSLAQRVLDTFLVVEPHPGAERPGDWTQSREKDLELWTDSDREAKIAEGLAVVHPVRAVMKKALSGKPFDDGKPLVKLYQNAARFESDGTAALGSKPEDAAYDPLDRALMIEIMSVSTMDYAWNAQQAAARHYVYTYFGGPVPLWLDRGLTIYGAIVAADGGKPTKLSKQRMNRARRVAATASRRLEEYFKLEAQDIPNDEAAYEELFAWHWFLRHAKEGKPYRKSYESCLSVLRRSGDVEKAHEAWKGTDFFALQGAWSDWGKGRDKDDDPDPTREGGDRPLHRPPPDSGEGAGGR